MAFFVTATDAKGGRSTYRDARSATSLDATIEAIGMGAVRVDVRPWTDADTKRLHSALAAERREELAMGFDSPYSE